LQKRAGSTTEPDGSFHSARFDAWVVIADLELRDHVIDLLNQRGACVQILLPGGVPAELDRLFNQTLIVADDALLEMHPLVTDQVTLLLLLTEPFHGLVDMALDAGADDVLLLPQGGTTLATRISVLQRRVMEKRSQEGDASSSTAERQARELKLLHQVRTTFATEIELTRIFRTIVEQVSAIFGYTHVSLYTLEKDSFLLLQHQIGYQDVLERIPLDRGVTGRVARTGNVAMVEDVTRDSEFLAAIPDLRSEICVPFFLGGRVAGIFNIESCGERTLGRNDLHVMLELAGFLNLAVERSELFTVVHSSEQRLRLALEAAGMGTWLWYPILGQVFWSEQMGPLYGLPVGTQSVGIDEWFSLIHPDDRETMRRVDQQYMRIGNDYETEFRVVLPSGAIRWLEGKGRVVERTPNGEIAAIVGVTMDVTGRKRLEEERIRLVQLDAERAKASEAQKQITDTLERMTAAFFAIDWNWKFTFLNRRALSMVGRPRDELIGQVVWDVFPELIGTEIEEEFRSSIASQVVANFDARWPGLERWVEVHVYPAIDGLSVYLQDVTERRRAEEDQRRTEERFKSLVQNGSDIILILDHDGTVRYASPAIERVIGHTPEEVVGNDNFFRVHPEDAKRLRRAFVRVARKPGVSAPVVLRFRHRDGTYRWLEVTPTNLFHEPTIAGIVVNCRDITERHQAEYNLWFLAETSAVLGTSLDMETTLGSIARLVVMNLADMCIVDIVDETGEAEAFAVSHRHSEAERRISRFRTGSPLTRSSLQAPAFVLRTGISILYEVMENETTQLWARANDDVGEPLEFGFESLIVAPFVARGVITGVLTVASMTAGRFGPAELGVIEELARRAGLAVDNARLYQASRAAVEARDQFLSVAAHELRTPITAINGFSALLDRELSSRKDQERIARFVRRLTDAGTRLSSLVDDLLDVSRIRLGELPLRLNPVDLVDLVGRVRQRYEEQDSTGTHRFSLDNSSDDAEVIADEDRLDQVLSNVFDNAVKYTPDGGQIDLSIYEEGDGILVQVRDSGIGMPPEDTETIFQPFGRASNAALSNLPGLGLGLFICRNIVHRHGGRITAHSDGEGKGTTIALWLPCSGPRSESLLPI